MWGPGVRVPSAPPKGTYSNPGPQKRGQGSLLSVSGWPWWAGGWPRFVDFAQVVGCFCDFTPWAGEGDFLFVEVDLDLGEEGSVEVSPGFVAGLGVDGGALLHEFGGVKEGFFDLLSGGLGLVVVSLGGELFVGDAGLFAAEQVEWDGFGVGHCE